MPPQEASSRHVVRCIPLVERQDLRDRSGADLAQHGANRVDLPLDVLGRGISDVHDQVRSRHLLERRIERLDQLVRELAHEPHRVRHRGLAPVGQCQAAGGGIERGERLIGDQDARPGQRVHQGRLARVRVSSQSDLRKRGSLPRAPFDGPAPPQVPDVPPELRDPAPDVLAVDLELRLAGASGADPAPQPGHGLAPSPEPWQEVVQLRQLDLGLPLAGSRVQGEDVQDQRGPVHHLDPQALLERAELSGSQLVVEDHGLGVARVHDAVQLCELPPADVRRRVRDGPRLDDPSDGGGAGGAGQGVELVQDLLPAVRRQPHQDSPLPDRGLPRRGEG